MVPFLQILGSDDVKDALRSLIRTLGALRAGLTSTRFRALTRERLRKRNPSLSFEVSPFFISQRVERMIWNTIVIVGRSLGEWKHIVRRSLIGGGHS